MANKWMQKLLKLEGALVERRDPFKKGIKTGSPSVNFIFGKTHLLPAGYSVMLYGSPKGGKSVLAHLMIGWLHQSDPEAIAVKIDPEFRSEAQLTDEMMALYGIDPDRLLVIQTNSPAACFDQIEGPIAAHCQAGAPIKLIVIDSISGIQGRREIQNESVENQTIGDHAQTVQIGLKRILPVIRKHEIATVLVVQARAEMDQTEQKRGNKIKAQAGFGLQHFCEYFIVVDQNKNKEGRSDMLGNESTFVNADATDMAGKGEVTAAKIRVKMKDSSLGPKGRTGEFTFHFHKGIVNVHEEAFKLGTARSIITSEKQGYYEFADEKWHGKEACLRALQEDPALCEKIIEELKRRDLAGEYAESDAANAAEMDREPEL